MKIMVKTNLVQKSNAKEIQYFRQLDGFRFLCISAVMISHFGESVTTNRFPLGYGVMFFFVLSSFLITRILLTSKDFNESKGMGNKYSLRQFYVRRFLRIFPIYYLLIIFMYAINWVPCRQIIVSLLTFTTNFKIGSGFNAGDFNHLWSLAVEEQFYIFFPFLIYFIKFKNIYFLLLSFIFIGLAGRAALFFYNAQYLPFSNFHTISCLDSLGIGGLLAYMSIYKADALKVILTNKISFPTSILTFLAFMIFSFSIFTGSEKYNFTSMVFMRFFFNVMSFWILGWAVIFGYKGLIKTVLENKVVVYLGRISYGLYLYHLFVPRFVTIVLHHFRLDNLFGNDIISFIYKIIIYTSVTIVIASGSWFIIEKPINGLKKYFNYNRELKLAA